MLLLLHYDADQAKPIGTKAAHEKLRSGRLHAPHPLSVLHPAGLDCWACGWIVGQSAKNQGRPSPETCLPPSGDGWLFVHLQGTPAEIGFQHGYLLAPEIEDALKVTIFEQTRDDQKGSAIFP